VESLTGSGKLRHARSPMIAIARGYRPGLLELTGAGFTIAALAASNLLARRPQRTETTEEPCHDVVLAEAA
jgi:hypothetical protein